MNEPGTTREDGFALLIVLWALGLLALLVSGLAAAGRSDLSIAGNTRDSAVVEAAADGAVQQAMFQLMSGTWTADGAPHRLAIGRATVLVRIEDQRGKLNPNLSALPMLAALLGALGTDPETALDLAGEMADWRTVALVPSAGRAKLERYRLAGLPYGPANAPFASLDEVGLIPGMTPSLLARLKPYLSIYQTGYADRGQGAARPGRAMQFGGAGPGAPGAGTAMRDQVVLIHAAATMQGGISFAREATVGLRGTVREGEQPWQILTWDQP